MNRLLLAPLCLALSLSAPGALADDDAPPAATPPDGPPAAAPPGPPPAASIPPPPPAEPSAPAAPPPSGQWTYTSQYGWLWMPYDQAYTYVYADSDVSYEYVYYPAFGWRWVASPWVLGFGPSPFWGVRGRVGFAWYAHPWFHSDAAHHGGAARAARSNGGATYRGGAHASHVRRTRATLGCLRRRVGQR